MAQHILAWCPFAWAISVLCTKYDLFIYVCRPFGLNWLWLRNQLCMLTLNWIPNGYSGDAVKETENVSIANGKVILGSLVIDAISLIANFILPIRNGNSNWVRVHLCASSGLEFIGGKNAINQSIGVHGNLQAPQCRQTLLYNPFGRLPDSRQISPVNPSGNGKKPLRS